MSKEKIKELRRTLLWNDNFNNSPKMSEGLLKKLKNELDK